MLLSIPLTIPLAMPEQTKKTPGPLRWFALAALLLLAAGGVFFYQQSGKMRFEGVLQSNLRALASEYGGQVARVEARPGLRVLKGAVLVRFEDTALRSALLLEEQQLQALAMLVPPGLARVRGEDGREESLTARLDRQRQVEETAELRVREASEKEARAAILYSRASMLATQGKLDRQELEKAESYLAAARKEAREARQAFETLSLERAATGMEIQRMRDMQSLTGADRLSEEVRLKNFAEQELRVSGLRAALEAATITAPGDGTVIEVGVQPGDRLAPMQPALLFRSDGQALRVRALAPESKAARLRAGQPCQIRLHTPDTSHTGRLEGFVSAVLPGMPNAGNGEALAAVWFDILPQQGGEAGRSLPISNTPATVTVLLRAPLISALPRAENASPQPGTPSTNGRAAPGASPAQAAQSPVQSPTQSIEAGQAPPPPELPPMQAPGQRTGTVQPDPNNNPSIVPHTRP